MNSLKNKLGILAVVLCLCAVVLIVWFLLLKCRKAVHRWTVHLYGGL